MNLLRRQRGGFSLAEVLISIAVLSIGILGTVAALAFGLRATDLGARTTVAVNLNRKMLEMILSQASSYTIISANNVSFANFDGPVPSSWAGSTSDPYIDTPFAQTGGIGWHRLDAAPFDAGVFVNTADPKELKRFNDEILPNFERNITGEPLSSSTAEFGHYMARVVVTTRWRDKGEYKYVRTEGIREI